MSGNEVQKGLGHGTAPSYGYAIKPLPTDPTEAQLEYRRRASVAPPPQYTTLPGAFVAGGGLVAMNLSYPILAFALLAVGYLMIFLPNRKEISSTGLQTNVVDDKVVGQRMKRYLVGHTVTSLLPLLGGFVATVPLVATLPEWAAFVGGTLLVGAGANFAVRRLFTLNTRDSRLRLDHILESDQLDGVTAGRLEVAESSRNAAVAKAMWTAGAFDGTQIQLWKLAHIMGIDIDTVHAAVAELEAAGLARTSTIQAPNDPPKWYAELTVTGVRVYNQLGQR